MQGLDLNQGPPAYEAGELTRLLHPAKMWGNWWNRRGSNPRPPRCHRGALSTELLSHGGRTQNRTGISGFSDQRIDHVCHSSKCWRKERGSNSHRLFEFRSCLANKCDKPVFAFLPKLEAEVGVEPTAFGV